MRAAAKAGNAAESAIPCALQRRCSALWKPLLAAGVAALLCAATLTTSQSMAATPSRAAPHTPPIAQHLLPGSDMATPVYVRDSGNSGPTVLIVGAIHGDEPAGAVAAERLLAEHPARGRWIVVPVVNRRAREADVRTPYDMPDLNRSFPGAPTGNASARLAAALLALVERHRPALVLDLHEALPERQGKRNELANSLIVSESPAEKNTTPTPQNAENAHNAQNSPPPLAAAELALALVDGPPLPGGQRLTVLAGAPAGSFNREAAHRFGVPVITVESDRGEPLDARITFQLAIVHRLLGAIGGGPR